MMHKTLAFAVLALFGTVAFAQTGITYSTEAEALGVYSSKDHGWHAGEDAGVVAKIATFGATSQHSLYVLGSELDIPDFDEISYLGGLRFQPDISSWLGKHTVLPTTIGVHFQAEAGNTIDTSKSTSTNYFSQRYGGGVSIPVKDTTTGEIVVHVVNGSYLRVGNVNDAVVTAGIAYIFGDSAKTETAKHRAAGKLARAMARR